MKGDKKVQRIITEFVRMADSQPKTCRICGWVTSAKVVRSSKVSHEKQMHDHVESHRSRSEKQS
ncbi:MAG: hypothetical protein DMD36_07605 [Gemmatimonadetes bacterium]|nr:MAG: hypothetical protein DMD36_07605 [Gemmatimonadota bacterium]